MSVELVFGIQQRRVGNTVQRAIDMTKRRQAYDKSTSAQSADSSSPMKSNQRPVRMEKLDVMRLNQLIKNIDKTWIMPRNGSREPIGSNFQYKKTCANIYKSRPAACQQVGFGVLCVNYCYEQGIQSHHFHSTIFVGEELNYKCQDISDSSYCRSNANYESFFSKYRKDAYKVKAFIHQMISRCYATAICNAQGILNTTFTSKPDGGPKSPKESSVLAAANRPSQLPQKTKPSAKSNSVQHKNQKPSIWERYAAQQPSQPQETQPPPAAPNSGVIGPPADGDEFDGQPRYVPFWQRLLKRKHGNTTTSSKRTTATVSTTTTTTESVLEVGGGEVFSAETQAEEEPEENRGDELDVEEDMLVAVATTTTPQPTTAKRLIGKRRRLKPIHSTTLTPKTTRRTTTVAIDEEIDTGAGEENEEIEMENQSQTSQPRYTFKPLPQTTTAVAQSKDGYHKPAGPFEIVAAASNHEDEASALGSAPAFWNKFQPGRWFQSIHYMTNTG
ncbi:Protein CYN-17, isoform a [Aphelenchoides besseyi]|nr:Protein CYN-17, isoform a [Aphelenchoides besseyi]